MSDTLFFAPDPSDEPYTGLARSVQGRIFRKHILSKGPLLHHELTAPVEIDEQFFDTMIDNFQKKIVPHVQVPLANKNNEHDESPDRNIGEVIGLEKDNNKLYAVIDFRKHAEDVGRTLLGVSAGFGLNELNTMTGERVGPALRHTAVTNRPYLTNLEDFEEIVAASNSNSDDKTVFLTAAPVETKEGSIPMTLEELMSELKTTHNIDVADLQSRAASTDATETAVAELSNKIKEVLGASGVIKLSANESIDGEEIVGAVAALAERSVNLSNEVKDLQTVKATLETNQVALSSRLESLETDKATAEVEKLVDGGFILPATRDAMLELRLSNAEMFTKLIPAAPIVKLSHEEGRIPDKVDTAEEQKQNMDRYEAMMKDMGAMR